MNKKNILIITGFVVLSVLLIITSISLHQTQNDFRIFTNYIGYVFHVLSIKNFQDSKDHFDISELVVGKEKGFCESVDGVWVEDTRECLNISEIYCRMITGNMTVEQETNKFGNCILK